LQLIFRKAQFTPLLGILILSGFLILTVITLGFFANFLCSAKSRVFVVRLCTIPGKNLAVPAVFLFCSKGETNLGTGNFFLGRCGASRVYSGSLGGGEGGELNGGRGDGGSIGATIGDDGGLGRGSADADES
jgi:hypothetical protein